MSTETCVTWIVLDVRIILGGEEMINFEAVGKMIHKNRVEHHYSQDLLAEKLYVSRQAVSRWELGQSIPSIDNLIELSRIFHVSIDELLCLDNESKDTNDIFQGKNRNYVVQNIIRGKQKVDVYEVFGQFTGNERILLIKAFKTNKIVVNINLLRSKLSPEELKILNMR